VSNLDLPALPAWFDQALCARVDPEMFFPKPGNVEPAVTRLALAICARCEVRAACLQYAVDEHITHGIWGGETANQRRERRKHSGAGPRRRPRPTVCSAGHALVEGNIRVRADRAVMCLKCEARRARESRARRRARQAAKEVTA
jgi:WhiB family transcriptional regulator, redox-sensing transcriptional regulator